MSATVVRRVALVSVLLVSIVVLWRWTDDVDHRSDASDAVTVFGPWLGSDGEAFTSVLEDFTDRTGIPVRYTGSNDFDTDLRQRVSRGLELPDVAVIPQPGLILELAGQEVVTPLADSTVDVVLDNYGLTREQLAPDGTAYLLPFRTHVKSLVWFRPSVFEEYGWEAPTTLDGLAALTDEMVDEGVVPWCFALESGASTGWTASDWIEDLLVRRAGRDVYEQWLRGDLPFTDQHVVDALTEFDDLVLQAGHTAGGLQRVLSTSVDEAVLPLFDDPPGCAMSKDASFATSWFPDDTTVGPDGDVDFFVLPGVDAAEPAPLLRAGEGLVQFDDRDEVVQLMDFLAGPNGGDAWMERGGYLSGRTSVAPDAYGATDRLFIDLLDDGRVEVFDASDAFRSALRDTWLAVLVGGIADQRGLDEREAYVEALLEEVDEVRQRYEDVPDDAEGIVDVETPSGD